MFYVLGKSQIVKKSDLDRTKTSLKEALLWICDLMVYNTQNS